MALDGKQVEVSGIREIVRGATWDPIVVVKDKVTGLAIPLTAWVGAGKGVRLNLRQSHADASPVATPVCTILDSGTTGRVQFVLTAAETTALSVDIAQLKGDPEFYDNSSPPEVVRKPFRFTVDLLQEYTK